MRSLTLREQLLIGVLALTIVGIGVGWGLSGWQGQAQGLERQLAQTQRQLRELDGLVAVTLSSFSLNFIRRVPLDASKVVGRHAGAPVWRIL